MSDFDVFAVLDDLDALAARVLNAKEPVGNQLVQDECIRSVRARIDRCWNELLSQPKPERDENKAELVHRLINRISDALNAERVVYSTALSWLDSKSDAPHARRAGWRTPKPLPDDKGKKD
ncbi:MAG: hypothetical protein ACREEI_02825 [Stellaceae bacterium]